METLKNKNYGNFNYLSRYSHIPYYFDSLEDREVYGIGMNMKNNTEYVTHVIKANDTVEALALKYYNNPTYWWIIAYFNDIQDAFKPLRDKYTTIKIPNISSVEFGRVNT
jgi:hypothetical protein